MSAVMSSPRFASISKHRLLWPLVTLAILLAINATFNPNFLHLAWRDGHLYGSLIDILNRAAPLMLVALGMTLVIATRGIDISVGATVAIAAALVAWMIGGKLVMTDGVSTYVSRFPMSLAIIAALAVALLCGAWNGLLVARVGMQPIIATLILMVAGRGIAQLITGGQIITIYYAPYFFLGNDQLRLCDIVVIFPGFESALEAHQVTAGTAHLMTEHRVVVVDDVVQMTEQFETDRPEELRPHREPPTQNDVGNPVGSDRP